MIENYFTPEFLTGNNLVGDSFDFKQIEQWYKEEEEAYATLSLNDDEYLYRNINNYYGLEKLISTKKDINILCFGAAYGGEITAIEDILKKHSIQNYSIIMIDSSTEMLKVFSEKNKHIHTLKAQINGEIKLEENSIDLITCFGVLHHIPNVSFILQEFHRILKPNAIAFIREPISSMGDWRTKRYGCTINERGIPVNYFHKICRNTHLSIQNEQYAFFPPLIILGKKLRLTMASVTLIKLDRIFSFLFTWNVKYYRKYFLDKFAPSSCYWTLKK